MGFAVDRMQRRWGAFGAGVVLGVIWAAWHVVPFVQAHRPPEWIAWQSLFMVATRVLIVWIYNNTGRSVAAAILFHDVSNVAVFSFPDHGSHYDPRIAGLITAVVAAFVTVMWGPRTLARHENA